MEPTEHSPRMMMQAHTCVMIVVMIVVNIEAWDMGHGPGSKNQNKVPMTETTKCKRKTDRGRSAVCDDRGDDV